MDINVKNLSKKFNNYVAVNNINFSLDKNKTLGLLGPNGCGKTTSIGMMLGLITPSSGEVIINGQNVNNANHDDLLSKIGKPSNVNLCKHDNTLQDTSMVCNETYLQEHAEPYRKEVEELEIMAQLYSHSIELIYGLHADLEFRLCGK